MRVYRETLVATATSTSVTLTSIPIQTGFMRIYEGRVAENLTAARGSFVAFLGNPANVQVIGNADLVTVAIAPGSFVGIAEEAGRRNYWENEYWTLRFIGLATGDVVRVNLFGTEMTIFQYQKGNTY